MDKKAGNGLYFVDDDHKIIYFNAAAKAMYPELEKGQYCYETFELRSNPCPHCPFFTEDGRNSFFNAHRSEWIYAQGSFVELPEIGKCRAVSFSRTTAEDNKEGLRGIADKRAALEAAGTGARTGMIGGYCEKGFPLYFANQQMISMLGYDDYEDFCKGIKGMVSNTIHPDDMAQVEADIGGSYYVGLEYTTIYRMPRKDGTWFWTIDKGRVVKAEDGRLAIVSFCTDITDSIKNQEFLEEQNRLLQKQNRFMEFISDGMPGGYHRCGVDNGYPLMYVSEKFLKMIGFTREELSEKFDNKFLNLIHPDDRPYLNDATSLAAAGNGEVSVHYRILTKDGYMQVVDTSRAIECDGTKFFQGVIIDISKESGESRALEQVQKSLSEALVREQDYRRQLSEMQNEILGAISCGVFAYTVPDHELLIVNSAAKRMIGCPEDGDPVSEMRAFLTERIIRDDRERAISARQNLTKVGDAVVQDYRAVINGRQISVHCSIKLLERISGQPYILVTLLDTTELEDKNTRINNVLSMQKQMAEALGSGIFAYTLPEHEVLILNREAKRMFDCMGSSPDRYGTDIISRIDRADMENVRGAVKKLVSPGDSAEYIFHSGAGEGRHSFKCLTKLESFEDGQKYILSAITDITEQELTERMLDEERRQYHRALTRGSKGYFTLDLTDGVIKTPLISAEGVNLIELLGLSLPVDYDILAEKWFSAERVFTEIPDAEKIRHKQSLIECYQNGTSVLDVEYRVISENSYLRITVVLYKAGGSICANFVVFDITSDRHEERRRRAVIDSLGQIYSALYHFSLYDDSFIVLKANPDIAGDLERVSGYVDFCDHYIENFVDEEYKDSVRCFLSPDTIRKNLAESDYASLEFKRRGFGWCRVTLVAADRDEKGVVSTCVFAGNVIEKQKQAEFAQQEALRAAYESANLANAAKSDFLANMSHDIRTPMNAIIGMTAIAKTHIDDKERVSDCLSKISMSSKHLLGIINEVLDMSKIESGKMELQEEGFNLPELIDNLLTMSKPEVAAKDHTLSVSIKNIEHENVYGDSQRIQQVFMNLMSNAIKYTPRGGKIGLTITERPTNKQQVGCYEFVFCDNGIGMSKDFIERIFEPFSRNTDDSRIDKIQGTGLGMPITHNIVQMMNGNIKVESEINKGTTFTVTLFLRLQDTEENLNNERLIDLPILVADDDEDSCLYTCELLSEIGMKGEWVLSGAKAVEKVALRHKAEDDYFAVILDWKMPEMDGVETTREIRKRIGRDVPIIIISAYDWSDIELEARAAGANAFISKPLFKSRMVHLFNELVSGGSEEKETTGLEAFAEEDFSGHRALLVEDNALNSEIAGEILEMSGLVVEYAVNGKEALDMVNAAPDGYFSVVFMDIQMPIMNGYDATRAIRSLPRDYTRSVPIIAMSANAFAEDVSAAKTAGMNEHIAKPLDMPQLLNVLKKWVKK